MSPIPDIKVYGKPGSVGGPADLSQPADPNYKGKDAAENGTYINGECVCATPSNNGGSGNPGQPARQGSRGRPGPTLGFKVGRLLSDIVLLSQGGHGGAGGRGGDGTDGGDGQDAGTNNKHCLEAGWILGPCCAPANGGLGGDAGQGATGGTGGAGSDGGDIYVYYLEPQDVSPDGALHQVHPISRPGQVGTGGPPGGNGQPGLGGKNERVDKSTPERAPSGQDKPAPGWGINGNPPGEPGRVVVHTLPAERF